MPPLPLHIRIALTWVAIFPLVALTRFLLSPLIGGWPDLAQTALVITLVVPVAVTWVVPLLTRAYLGVRRARANRTAQ